MPDRDLTSAVITCTGVSPSFGLIALASFFACGRAPGRYITTVFAKLDSGVCDGVRLIAGGLDHLAVHEVREARHRRPVQDRDRGLAGAVLFVLVPAATANQTEPTGEYGGHRDDHGGERQQVAPVHRQAAVNRPEPLAKAPGGAAQRGSHPCERALGRLGWGILGRIGTGGLARGQHRLGRLLGALRRAAGPLPQTTYVARLLEEQERKERQPEEGRDAEERPDGVDHVHRRGRILQGASQRLPHRFRGCLLGTSAGLARPLRGRPGHVPGAR